MGHDDRHIGEIDGHVVEIHRIGIFQPHSVAAPHARPDAGLAGVEERRNARLRNRLVERPAHPVIGIEALHGRMKLEAPDAEIGDEAPRLPCAHAAAGRIDRGEGDQDIGMEGAASATSSLA